MTVQVEWIVGGSALIRTERGELELTPDEVDAVVGPLIRLVRENTRRGWEAQDDAANA